MRCGVPYLGHRGHCRHIVLTGIRVALSVSAVAVGEWREGLFEALSFVATQMLRWRNAIGVAVFNA